MNSKLSSENSIVALVPMKAHSERVPNKNIRKFAGQPLYHHILNTLCQSSYVKEVYIDTDSETISSEAPKISDKIKIIPRQKQLIGDFISMNDVIAYDLSKIKNEIFLQTHSTNPLLSLETIESAIAAFLNNRQKFDSLFAVTKLQTRLYDQDGNPINHRSGELIRTQDLPPVFEENSNLYIFTKDSFRNSNNNRIGERPQMFEVDKLEATDIDTEKDWVLAETMKQLGL